MEQIELKAQKRNILGKKVKALRAKGLLPAILYGHQVKSQILSVATSDFKKIFQKAGTSSLVDLKIEDEKPIKVLIHEPQLHPVYDEPLHVDFYLVKMTEKIKTEIPIKIVGEPPAVKELGANLIVNKTTLEVECLPEYLISEIEADVSGLKNFEDRITVGQLSIPEKIEVLANPEEVVALVEESETAKELEEMEQEEAAGAEKEQIEKLEAETEAKKVEEGEAAVKEEKPAEGQKEEPSVGAKTEQK